MVRCHKLTDEDMQKKNKGAKAFSWLWVIKG